MTRKMKRYNGAEGSEVGEAVGDSNEGMKEAYDVGQAEMRINDAKERMRAEAEGARDEGKITESGDQGFGGAGSSRTVKAKPKAMPKADLKPAAKAESAPAPKATPVDETKFSANERMKRTIEKNLSGARSGSGPTDTRSINQRLRAAFGMKKGGATKKMASGGMTSSASKRADGIATKGKTRGKMV